MNIIVVLLLFAGMALVMQGVYDEKVKALEKNVRVEYRFLPRTLYEEQMAHSDLLGKFKTLFDEGGARKAV